MASSHALALVIALGLPAEGRAARSVSLEEALALATRNNPTLAASRARLNEAEADSAITRSSLLPRVYGGAYFSWLDPNRLSPTGLALPGGTMPSLFSREGFIGIRGKQVVFDGLKSWRSLGAARRGVEAEQAATRSADADVVLHVTQSFVRLLESQRLTDVAERSVARQEGFETVIAEQLKQGKGARLDLLKAQAQRLEAERGLVVAREGQRSAAAQLRRAIGLESREELAASGELLAPAEDIASGGVLLEAALESNPDLRRLEAQVRQAEALMSAARGGYFPEVSLQGAYGHRARDVGGSADEWTAGVFLDWTLFDGLANRAQVSKAQARVAQLKEARRALVLQIESDLTDALAAFRAAHASVRSTEKAVEVSREGVDAALALYQLGRAVSLDVLTSQADLVRAEANHVVATGDSIIASARLSRIAGGHESSIPGASQHQADAGQAFEESRSRRSRDVRGTFTARRERSR